MDTLNILLILAAAVGAFYIHCEHVKRVLFGPECNHKDHVEEDDL